MSMFTDMAQGAAWSDLVRVHGREVTYKSQGAGSGTAIDAIWIPGAVMPEYNTDGSQDAMRGVLRVNPTDVTHPSLRDTFLINGETWAVAALGRSVPYIELQLEKRMQRRVGGETGRIKR